MESKNVTLPFRDLSRVYTLLTLSDLQTATYLTCLYLITSMSICIDTLPAHLESFSTYANTASKT